MINNIYENNYLHFSWYTNWLDMQTIWQSWYDKYDNYLHIPTWCVASIRGGGALTQKGVMGMCRGHDPLFWGQSALPSLPIYHHYAALVPPHFQILEKNSIFSLVLVKISALKMQIFPIFVPKTPHFSRKIRSLDPTSGNPCGTPTKKKESPPPRRGFNTVLISKYTQKHVKNYS